MARWLLDCEPISGRPWRLGVADTPAEKAAAYRLRNDVFYVELGYGPPGATRGATDADEFDAWCDQLVLVDEAGPGVVATFRALWGAEAVKHTGLYGQAEFDYAGLAPIAHQILQGGRTCVAPDYRTGPAITVLNYGMELLLREYGAKYFLGLESFTADEGVRNRVYSAALKFGRESDYTVTPWPANRVAGLAEVPVTTADERLLPAVVRLDLRMGFRACGPLAWDPEFRCYDIPMLGRRDRMTKVYDGIIDRIERAARRTTR